MTPTKACLNCTWKGPEDAFQGHYCKECMTVLNDPTFFIPDPHELHLKPKVPRRLLKVVTYRGQKMTRAAAQRLEKRRIGRTREARFASRNRSRAKPSAPSGLPSRRIARHERLPKR